MDTGGNQKASGVPYWEHGILGTLGGGGGAWGLWPRMTWYVCSGPVHPGSPLGIQPPALLASPSGGGSDLVPALGQQTD